LIPPGPERPRNPVQELVMNDRMPDEYELVIGVDTHKHAHTAAVLDAATAGQLQLIELTNDRAGYTALRGQVPDRPRVWAIEGAGGYGAGLARWLAERGETVVEVERPRRAARRHGAKSDPIDAVRAAREALSGPTGTPKQGQVRAVLAARLTARRSAVEASATAQRQLLALVVTAPPTLHERLAKLRTRELIARCERLRSHASHDIETAETIVVLRRLACRIRDLEAEAAEHETALRRLVAQWRPDLLEVQGVGPIVAATLLCSWSHPGRITSEAAFAQLAGVAPIPASSGQTTRYRLSRFGDRQLNRALHTIVLTRLQRDPTTRAYAERRRAEGKTDREIKRCLKRYIARQLYRQLEAGPLNVPT
jgi:transposase